MVHHQARRPLCHSLARHKEQRFVWRRARRTTAHHHSSVLVEFNGIDMWPVNLEYRVHATFVKHNVPIEFKMASASGTTEIEHSFGRLDFSLHGHPMSLQSFNDPSKRSKWVAAAQKGSLLNQTVAHRSNLFLIFGDKTTGKATYGGGRFVYCAPPDANGNVVLDFNQGFCCCLPFFWRSTTVSVQSAVRLYAVLHLVCCLLCCLVFLHSSIFF